MRETANSVSLADMRSTSKSSDDSRAVFDGERSHNLSGLNRRRWTRRRRYFQKRISRAWHREIIESSAQDLRAAKMLRKKSYVGDVFFFHITVFALKKEG